MMTTPAGGNGQAPNQPADPAGGNGQAPTPAQANNGGSPSAAGNGQAPTPIDSTSPSADEWKRVRQELDEARRNAANYRDELKKFQDSQLSAEQKRERDFAEMQTKTLDQELRLQRLALENAGLRLAPSLGIADPSAALALVQTEHEGEIEYDDKTHQPKNLEALLKKVLTAHPLLAAQQQAPRPPSSGGAANPGRQAGNGGLTPEIIEAMTNRERVARWPEIDAWRKANPDAMREWAARQPQQ